MTNGSLKDLLSRDHDRLDELLASGLQADGGIDERSYQAFRAGLLWHIGVEEGLQFQAMRREAAKNRLAFAPRPDLQHS